MKIKKVGLTKLNNAEYKNFMTRLHDLFPDIESERPEEVRTGNEPDSQLGITQAQRDAFSKDHDLLVEIVNQSFTSNETEDMLESDKNRNKLVVFLTTHITQTKKSPIEEQHLASRALYNLVKPYIGLYKLPNQQRTALIDGLLLDLTKPGIPENISKLGLTEIVSSLKVENERYATLTIQRTKNKAAAVKENSTFIRARMSKLYDEISTMVFAQSVCKPSPDATAFIVNLNALIDETTALYNQRMAAAKAQKKTI